MFGKMKQMYDLQKKAKEIQKKLSDMSVEHSYNGVKIKINGVFKVESLDIQSDLLNPSNKENLESTLCRTFSEAIQSVQKKSASESQDLLKGFSL